MRERKGLILFIIFSVIVATAFTAINNWSPQLSVVQASVHAAEEDGGHKTTHSKHDANAAGAGHGDVHSGEHHSEEAPILTNKISWQGWLPLWTVLLPFFGAILAVLRGKSDRDRNWIVVSTCALTMFLLILMYGPVVNGVHINGQLYKGLASSYNFLPGFDFTFRVDAAGLTVSLVTAFLWLLSGIYAITYMTIEENRTRYDFFMLATLAADIGVLLAGDFLTLFIFFEGLIIFPYALVAHKEDPGAIRGANMYLYLGVVSSLTLLMGIALFSKYTGSLAILPVSDAVLFALTPGRKYLLTTLMVIGFGGKAGLFLEHIWLPNAHPVAPTPASALLSGAMIKAGAYGIFRVVCMLFVPKSFTLSKYVHQWATMSNIGYVIIWVGVISMFLAVLSALITANSKRMLAFHSVSQMGYIIMGIGCAAYMGADGAMGLAGSLYHIVNHAIFKCALFLGVGAMYFRTHELDMYKLGGMAKKMPVVATGLFIAACGISGIPGFNGFASKTLLHHAILEAYEHSAHLAGGVMDYKLKIAEIIFMVTAGGTFASNMKLFALTCLGKNRPEHEEVEPAPRAMRVAIIMVSFAILYIGLRPNWLLETLIGPALANFNFNPASHAYHLVYNTHSTGFLKSTIPLLYPVGEAGAEAWSAVIHNLLGGGTAIMMGGMYFVLGMRFGWFHIEVPENLQFGYFYKKVYYAFKWFCTGPVEAFARAINCIISWIMVAFWQPVGWFVAFCKGPSAAFDKFVAKIVLMFMMYMWLPLVDTRSAIAKWDKYIMPQAWKERGLWQPIVAKCYLIFCNIFAVLDRSVVDGLVNATAEGVGEMGSLSRRTQTGLFQQYALAMVMGILLLAVVCLFVL